jgi:hypothetical protein
MADGAVNLTLDDYLSAKLVEKAKAMGVAPETLAADLLRQTLAVEDGFGGRHTDHVSNHDLNEEGRPWDEVRPELLARMKQKLAERT